MSSKDKKDQKIASEKKEEKKTDLGSLEEDDDFEEFPMEDWNEKQENKADLQVWEDDWDDDDVEDDFSQQLRAELEKNGMAKK
ncbi:26S proteasome complex subunit SEM1-like [Clytia hemisphaerica]|uniref:26S proteasome complex subunit SEM1-like n=1 Tax=Clytia hemisphaerica TaxID=252671 RepID=UPI0034D687F8